MADRDWADETAAELFPCTCTVAFREVGIHHRSCLSHNRPKVIAALEVARAEGRREVADGAIKLAERKAAEMRVRHPHSLFVTLCEQFSEGIRALAQQDGQ